MTLAPQLGCLETVKHLVHVSGTDVEIILCSLAVESMYPCIVNISRWVHFRVYMLFMGIKYIKAHEMWLYKTW